MGAKCHGNSTHVGAILFSELRARHTNNTNKDTPGVEEMQALSESDYRSSSLRQQKQKRKKRNTTTLEYA